MYSSLPQLRLCLTFPLFALLSCTTPPRPGEQTSPPVPTPYAIPFPRVPAADPAEAQVPAGFRVELAISGLTWPSSIAVDEEGNLYVAEAGKMFGCEAAPPRLLQIGTNGTVRVVSDQLVPPVSDLLWFRRELYVSHAGKLSVFSSNRWTDIVSGLPSWGEHGNTQLCAGTDGLLYLGQGTASNSGIVSPEDYLRARARGELPAWDLSPRALQLTGEGVRTLNPARLFASTGPTRVKTGAFQPFGVSGARSISPVLKANGVIFRLRPDGSHLEIYAWGLRNPAGLVWALNNQLYASDQGYQERGSRPIAAAHDVLWRIYKDAWYGWPDFSAGVPVSDDRFAPSNGPRPGLLLRNHPPVEKPLALRGSGAGVMQMDVCTNRSFGFEGQLFLAERGSLTSEPGNTGLKGSQVVRIDPFSGISYTFFRNREGLPASLGPTAGPRRIVDLCFSPAGPSLYLVDAGVILPGRNGGMPRALPGTGVIWRICRTGSPEILPRSVVIGP